MRHLISATLVITAIIHLMPLAGMLGSEQLSKLYGLPIHEPNLVILMRHRAVLFGLLGLFMLVAACRPAIQGVALVSGLVSVVSFLWFACSIGSYNAQLARVVVADAIAVASLIVGSAAHLYISSKTPDQSAKRCTTPVLRALPCSDPATAAR